MLIPKGVPQLGASNKGGVGKTSYFRAQCVNYLENGKRCVHSSY